MESDGNYTGNGTTISAVYYGAVSEWNQDLSLPLIPINVILVLYSIIGLFGNCAVVYIYNVKQRVKVDDRYFILVLAGMDIIVCLTGPAFSLVRNLLPVNFHGDILCRTSWFFVRTMSTASGILLIIIAIQRYLKVCRPFGKQMTSTINKMAVATTVIFAIMIDIPILLFYGETRIPNDERHILGYRCGRKDGESESLDEAIHIYFYFMFGSAISVMLGVIFLYTLTGRAIYIQIKTHVSLTSANYIATSSVCSYTDKPSVSRQDSNILSEDPKTARHKDTKIKRENFVGSRNSSRKGSSSKFDEIQNKSAKRIERQGSKTILQNAQKNSKLDLKGSNTAILWRKNRLMAHRFSIMFMMIAVVCTATYVPGLIVNVLINTDSTEFWTTYSSSERAIYLFLFQLYLLNHVVNPFIYAFFDKKFRRELKILLFFGKSTPKLQRNSH